MITSFELRNGILVKGIASMSLNINPDGYKVRESMFENLESAIHSAIRLDEDVIYCICGPNYKNELNVDFMEKIVVELVSEKIYSVYIDVHAKKAYNVFGNLNVFSDINRVSSFLLIRPIFNFVLGLLEDCKTSPDIDWLTFLKIIVPTAMGISDKANYQQENLQFQIISPFRNAVDYLEDYFRSVLNQNYQNYKIHIVDDYSSDNSCLKIPEHQHITFTRNVEQKGALNNIVDMLMENNFEDEDVICILDADDKLPHKYVLDIINSYYENGDFLLTYGSMYLFDSYKKFGSPYSLDEYHNLRDAQWRVTPLRTFKFKLFKTLLRADPELAGCKNDYGEFLKMPADMALFFPLIELAGYENIKFIESVTYAYRLHNSNDHTINRSEQYRGEMLVRSKKRLRI